MLSPKLFKPSIDLIVSISILMFLRLLGIIFAHKIIQNRSRDFSRNRGLFFVDVSKTFFSEYCIAYCMWPLQWSLPDESSLCKSIHGLMALLNDDDTAFGLSKSHMLYMMLSVAEKVPISGTAEIECNGKHTQGASSIYVFALYISVWCTMVIFFT